MNPPREVAEAAMFLRKSPSWLKREAAAGRVPHTKVGRKVLFTEEHLAAILVAGERQPEAAVAQIRTGNAIEKMRANRASRAPRQRAA